MFTRLNVLAAVAVTLLVYLVASSAAPADAASSVPESECSEPEAAIESPIEVAEPAPLAQATPDEVHRYWRDHCDTVRYTYGHPVRTCYNDRVREGDGTVTTHRICSTRIVYRTGVRQDCRRIPVWHFGGHAFTFDPEVGDLTTLRYA